MTIRWNENKNSKKKTETKKNESKSFYGKKEWKKKKEMMEKIEESFEINQERKMI